MELIIDPEFQSLIPDLSPEEYDGLKKSLMEEGCRDALVTWDGTILDGHNRYKICIEEDIPFKTINKSFEDREDAKDWIDANQLARRNLTPDQASLLRGRRYARVKGKPEDNLKQNAPKGQNGTSVNHADRLAKEHGVSARTIKRDGKVAEFLEQHPEEAKKVLNGEKKLKEVRREIKTEKRNERLAEREQKSAANKTSKNKFELFYSSVENLDLPEHSIDAIITDPPYGKEYLFVYEHLSLLASKVLKVGSPCLVMTGQSYLEEVLRNLSKYLTYQWTLAYLTPGSSVQVFGRKIKSNWKPIIFLTNGKNDWEHTDDVIRSDREDKRFHEWGQSITGMISIIEKFTVKNQNILDPFCGGGSTGVSCLLTDRVFIGADISEKEIEKTKERLTRL